MLSIAEGDDRSDDDQGDRPADCQVQAPTRPARRPRTHFRRRPWGNLGRNRRGCPGETRYERTCCPSST